MQLGEKNHFLKTSPILNNFLNLVQVILGLLILVFAVYKAYLVPFTHDEAFTWNNYVHRGVMDIISYKDSYGLPNNHILNTLLMKLSEWLFGSATWALRLPNLLALPVYLFAGYRLGLRLNNPLLRVGLFALLSLNLYLLDFFSLARGYGLSNACMLGSISLLIQWNHSRKPRILLAVFGTAMLAVLSNFTLIHFYLALFLLVLLMQLNSGTTNFRSFFRKNAIPFLCTALLGAIVYEPFRTIIKWKQTFGGSYGFWNDTVRSILHGTLYDQSYMPVILPVLLVFVQISCAFILVFAAYTFIKYRTKAFIHDQYLLSLLLIISGLLPLMQHYLIGTEFLIARTGLFLYPLFILVLFFSLDQVLKAKYARMPVYILAISLMGAALFHGFKAFSIRYVFEWKYDCSNVQLLQRLNNIRQGKPVHLGINWMYEPSLAYYRKSQHIEWLYPVNRSGMDGEFDFYYAKQEDLESLLSRGKVVIEVYQESNSFLLQ